MHNKCISNHSVHRAYELHKATFAKSRVLLRGFCGIRLVSLSGVE